jgi:hypothetical protein
VTDTADLYGLPLERFVPERDALAKAVRRDGNREEAARVGKLRKPSLPAWAVNQLVRTQGRAIAGLFEAGDALSGAQSALLAGDGDAGALREALRRERDAVEDLVATAGGLVDSGGHGLTPATLERVGETLHAAALDPEARAEVEGGCLVRELRHVGLGAPGAGATSSAPRKGARARADRAAAREAEADARDAAAREAESAAREAEAAAREAEAAARAVEAARDAAEGAARELAAAEARREQASLALHEAEDAVATARERAEAANRALREAEARATRPQV